MILRSRPLGAVGPSLVIDAAAKSEGIELDQRGPCHRDQRGSPRGCSRVALETISDDSEETSTQDEMARSIGGPVMEHLFRGHVPGRSGEIMLVPKPNNYLLGEWDLRTLGTDTPTLSTSHPNPWDYSTRVPIIASGGDIAAGATNDEVTDVAALAPTYAEMLGMDFDADGEPLDEVVAGFTERPKLIFSVILDGGGWNVLQQHPGSWPFIQSLRDSGITYTNANIGSAPSITGALHATMEQACIRTGTGFQETRCAGPTEPTPIRGNRTRIPHISRSQPCQNCGMRPMETSQSSAP